jgi:HlyD family secretion protein
MKTAIGIVVLGAIVAGIYLLNDYTRDEEGKSLLHVANEVEIKVEVTRPQRRDIVRTVQAPGEVEALDEVDISSEVVGKILEMPVEEGDRVEKGDLLCRLDDADFRARVLSAEANVGKLKALITQAEADLQRAELDWEQMQRLRETNASSPMELAYCRTALIGARAMLEMRHQELIEAEASLQYTREDLAKTVIDAPIDGIVSQRFAEQGEVVITGTMNNPGTRIMVISDLSKMQVRCRVDETDAPLVAASQTARIYLQSDTRRSISGEVFRVATKGTKLPGRDVVTFETLVLITADDPRVKPGMNANLEIEVAQQEDALTIPVEAVVYRKRRDLPEEFVQRYDAQQEALDAADRQHLAEYIKLVFCIEDGKACARVVRTGISDVNNVEIAEGLTLDDLVVTGPYRSLDRLKDGSPITLDEERSQTDTGEEENEADEQDAPGDAASRPASRPSDEAEDEADHTE